MKYRALIVDDEFSARELLKGMIRWANLGFELPTLATNGAEALHLLGTQDFQIVFTDVEMPIMDGMEFIRLARNIKPDQRFVIISCHEKFEYAQCALRLGVSDYILKDMVTENELSSLLYSVLPPSATLPEREYHVEPMDRLLKCAIHGVTPDPEPLPCNCAAIYAVVFDEIEKLKFKYGPEETEHRIQDFMAQISCQAVCQSDDDILYFMCQAPVNHSTLYFINDAMAKASAVSTLADQIQLGMISIGISNSFDSMSDLTNACREALEAVNVRITEGLNKIILYNCIPMKKQLVDHEYVENTLKRIEELSFHSNVLCMRYIDKLYRMELSSGFADANYYKYLNIRLWSMLVVLAKEKNFSNFEISVEMGLNLDEINQIEDSAIMAHFFKSVLMKLMSAATPKKSETIVSAALAIIEQEYTSDLSLNRLANELHTHKSYLCRAFKEQMGENLMLYIENKRIERAKYLLRNSQMKIWEISDTLGFASQQYFSFVFKKSAGISPTNFRKQITEENPSKST